MSTDPSSRRPGSPSAQSNFERCVAIVYPDAALDPSRIVDLIFSDHGSRVTGYTGPQIRTFLGNTVEGNSISDSPSSSRNVSSRSVDSAAFHLPLDVDDDTGIVLKVEEHAIPPPPRLALATDDSGHDWSVIKISKAFGGREVRKVRKESDSTYPFS